MPRTAARTGIAALGLALALSGCAHRAAPVAEAPAAAPPPPRPVLAGQYQGVVVPAVDAAGHYRTINAGVGADQAIWHVRAALNVAAIGCHGAEGPAIVAAYNRLLTTHKALLARANQAVEAQFRAQGGEWRDAHDRYMTRLYNYFALPPATPAFCQAAATLAPRAADTADAAFPDFAPTALLELEAPMIAVYQAIDDWKTQVADWDARYGPGAPATRVAQAAPGAAPKLRYDAIATVLAWEPRRGTAVALR